MNGITASGRDKDTKEGEDMKCLRDEKDKNSKRASWSERSRG